VVSFVSIRHLTEEKGSQELFLSIHIEANLAVSDADPGKMRGRGVSSALKTPSHMFPISGEAGRLISVVNSISSSDVVSLLLLLPARYSTYVRPKLSGHFACPMMCEHCNFVIFSMNFSSSCVHCFGVD
jgi:hypothetical protein